MLAAWQGKPFTYRGETIRVTPTPMSQPHPFFFVGGMSKIAARRAARFGLPFNRIYERYFVGLLLRDIADRHRRFPDLGEIDLPPGLSLFEFDDRYTAPQSNFRDARHYYETCSSLPLLPSVRIPCRILYSGDDPLVDNTALDAQSLPDNIERLKTRRGGHLGFVAAPWRTGGYRWMDQVVLRWLGV